MNLRLHARWMVFFLLIGVLVVGVAGLWIDRKYHSRLIEGVRDELTAEARIIALMPAEEIVRQSVLLGERSRARLTLIGADGRVLADTDRRAEEMDNHLHRSEIQEARLRGSGSAVRYSHTLETEYLYTAVLLGETSRPQGYVRLSRSISEIARSGAPLRRTLFQALIAIVALSLLIALIFSMRTLSPLRKLAAYAERARRGEISGTLRIQSRDEIGDLADHIQALVYELQKKILRADREREKLQSVFSAMTEGVVVLDADNRIETVSGGMEEITGRRSQELIGKTLIEAFRCVSLHDALLCFLGTGKRISREVDLADERPVTVDVTISAIRGETEGRGKTLLVFHDVTRLKQLERIRTDFVANVTHEIRTPLTAIIGFVETLLEGAVDDRETARRFLGTVGENAQRLKRLVDDLLTLSELELGDAVLRLKDLDFREVQEEVLAIVSARMADKGLNYLQDIPEGLPKVRADRDRLVQILLNLLDNAVKFTPAGGTVSVSAERGEAGTIVIRISDTGVGIPRGELPRLGERFFRVDRTRSREQGGTGLGLSIVKHLVKAHGGRITIDSTLGHGTTVSLHLPVFSTKE